MKDPTSPAKFQSVTLSSGDSVQPPDGDGDDGVADGDDDGGDDEDGERHEAHVELPLPLGAEVDPALSPELGDLLEVEEEEDGRGEDDAGEPGDQDQPLGSLVWKQSERVRESLSLPSSLTAPVEPHGVSDGVISVNAQSYQDISGAISDDQLTKPEDKNGNIGEHFSGNKSGHGT